MPSLALASLPSMAMAPAPTPAAAPRRKNSRRLTPVSPCTPLAFLRSSSDVLVTVILLCPRRASGGGVFSSSPAAPEGKLAPLPCGEEDRRLQHRRPEYGNADPSSKGFSAL